MVIHSVDFIVTKQVETIEESKGYVRLSGGGSGLYGATFAQQAKAHGKSVLVIDKRPNIAGNIYTEKVEVSVDKL